jgi:hypothetical protein
MTRSHLALISLAFCAACGRRDKPALEPARDTAASKSPVTQAGDTTQDDDEMSQACLGKSDTIEVTGPTIIATAPTTFAKERPVATATPADSAKADSLEDEEQEGNEADTDFVLQALGACGALHRGGITMYVNNYTSRVMRRRDALARITFEEPGFVFVDTSGVRYRKRGFLGKYRTLVLSDSLFGTHLSRGLEP